MVRKEWLGMEWIEIVEINDKIIRIRYYPEKKTAEGDFGEISYLRKTGERQLDKIVYGSNYAYHACQVAERVDQLDRKKRKFLQKDLIAWC